MYEIRLTKSFRKSLKRIVRSGQHKSIEDELIDVLGTISKKHDLPRRYKDHALKGEYSGYSECHLKPDLLLIYQIDTRENVVYAVDIGSHPELFS